MAWEQKLMRTVRVRNSQARGVLATLLTAISDTGGNVGGIEMLTETLHNVVRKGQIILALSNPNAEIDPDLALSRGAAFAADGKSVNNVLGFPGIFRGAVDAHAPRITHEMLVAAAETIASLTPPGDLVPNPIDKKVHQAVARAVAETAIRQGIARAEYVPYVED